MKTVDLIIPCYNEEESLPHFYAEAEKITQKLKTYQFNFWFIDDGSTDHTLATIQKLAATDPRIHYITFSRNFGKEAALLAGLDQSTGGYVAVMDADCQDPPSLLPDMFEYIESGYDTVATRRVTRKGEPPIRSLFARQFYKIINHLSNIEMVDGARDFRLMSRPVVDAIISCKEYNRYSKGLWSFVGFKTKWIEYTNVQRVAGESKWSFWKLFKYAIEGIVAFSTVPLTLAAFFGILFCFIAFIIILIVIVKTLIFGDPATGWPSLICIIMFMGGLQLFFLGIIGEYLAKTYLEVKNRPRYIIREKK